MNIGTVDTSSLGNNISLRQAEVNNTLENQKIDAGNTANAQAKTVYAAQVLTGALASGDPAIYAQAKSHLGDMGFDTSSLAADIPTATAQVNALRQAQYSANPLNALLGLGIKADANNIAAQSAAANPGAAAKLDPISALVGGKVAGMLGAPGAAAPVASAANTQALGLNPAPVPPGTPPITPETAPMAAGSGAAAASAVPPALAAPSAPAAAAPAVPGVIPSGVPAPPDPNKFVTENQYKQAMDIYNNDPQVLAARKKAEAEGGAVGEAAGKATEGALSSAQAAQNAQTTIQGVIDIAKRGNIYEGETAPAREWIANAVAPNSDAAQDYESFKTLNESQTIGAIRELADTGQIKMSRTLENIINRGYLVSPTASNAEKVTQANIIMTELKNAATAAGNVNSQLHGGGAQPLSPMNVVPSNSDGAQAAQVYVNLKNKGFSDADINQYMTQKGLK